MIPACAVADLPPGESVRTHTVLVYDGHIYVDTRSHEYADAPAAEAQASEAVA